MKVLYLEKIFFVSPYLLFYENFFSLLNVYVSVYLTTNFIICLNTETESVLLYQPIPLQLKTRKKEYQFKYVVVPT